jgi:hypothetical protein
MITNGTLYQSQEQQTDQHTNIYVNGNNNYINTAQSSNQGQGQSQEQGPSWTTPPCEERLGSDNTNGDCSNGCPWEGTPLKLNGGSPP